MSTIERTPGERKISFEEEGRNIKEVFSAAAARIRAGFEIVPQEEILEMPNTENLIRLRLMNPGVAGLETIKVELRKLKRGSVSNRRGSDERISVSHYLYSYALDSGVETFSTEVDLGCLDWDDHTVGLECSIPGVSVDTESSKNLAIAISSWISHVYPFG